MPDISLISIIFTAALTLVCLFLILSPLLKWDTYFQHKTGGQDLSISKEALLTTLNELEFEYKMDKISHADYKNLRKQYEVEIANILQEEERLQTVNIDEELMAEVEKEIELQMKSYKKQKGDVK
ncbi:hypothetical protein [Neobacillus dielmonensis]|uniref:hypothetical protein n=1 Tax=Neobacillus dielmonensis TaxID=1347369 RepID=UPI0005A5EDF7|nr:hypothetical protein [Neobacillus dielmonensis]